MIRLRSPLLLLAIAALLLPGAVLADTGPADSLNLCAAPDPSTAVATPVASLDLIILPPDDFILCTCKRCKEEPYTVCQISPSGYSIVCADWYRTHCVG